jgi:RHS repeat-associated protein
MYQLTALARGTLNSGQTAIQTGSQDFAEQWTLDATGNWAEYKEDTNGDGTWELDQTRAFDPANEITGIAGSSSLVGYDLAGNMTTMPQPGNWSASYTLTFDAWNRLVQIANGQTTVATYAYDARNFRAMKTAGTGASHFYYSTNWQVLEERIPISDPQSLITASQNVWGLRYIDDLVLRDRNAESAPNTGNLGLTGSSLDERLYALQDPNWNVLAVCNLSGAIQERYCYTAYGKQTFLSAAFANPNTSSAYAFDTLYTGRQLDPEFGLYYYRNRYYGADVGRFLSSDPIGYKGGINLYGYVGDSPTNRTDATGEISIVYYVYTFRVSGTCAKTGGNGSYDLHFQCTCLTRWTAQQFRGFGRIASLVCCLSVETCFGNSDLLMNVCIAKTFPLLVAPAGCGCTIY